MPTVGAASALSPDTASADLSSSGTRSNFEATVPSVSLKICVPLLTLEMPTNLLTPRAKENQHQHEQVSHDFQRI
jgi:hypothetical protein